MVKKILLITIILISALFFTVCSKQSEELDVEKVEVRVEDPKHRIFEDEETIYLDYDTEAYRIGVFLWHESVNDLTAFTGVLEGFSLAEISSEFYIRLASGNIEKGRDIVEQFRNKEFDLIYTIGTEATILVMEEIHDVPIVFTAVTNPVGSNIIPDWESSGRNITGNSNWVGTKDALEIFKETVPHLKTLGLIHDNSEIVNSNDVHRIVVEKIESCIQNLLSYDLEMEIRAVDEISDLKPAIESMAGKIDALWIPTDYLIYSNISEMEQVTITNKIPMLASSHRGVKDGAMVGVVVDFNLLGRLSVSIADKILTKGIDPRDIPIGRMNSFKIMINRGAAKKIDYDIPLEILSIVDIFIE